MKKEKLCGIYCIENIVNMKKYIGQSKDIDARFYNHAWLLNNNKHQNSYLQYSWNKYGENNFNFYIVEICDLDSIDEKECYYINLFNTSIDNYGYNLDSGGNKNKFHSQETKDKISQSNTGKINTEETRKKISLNRKGKMTGENHFMYKKCLSDIIKKKISNKLMGMFSGDKHYEAKKIICLNTGMIFATIKDAAVYYGIKASNISKCCTNLRFSAGKLSNGIPLQWDYYVGDVDYELKEYTPKTNAKSVVQFDLNNNYINTYVSAREAESKTGIGYKLISRVCTGERKQTCGYIFKFAS